MDNIFDAPPEGALATNFERALPIEYKSMKIPQMFADKATPEAVADYLKNGALGFSYYVSETKQNVTLHKFTFVVLETYVGISGFDKDSGISYWSSRAKDTRTDPITVFSSSNPKTPIATGLYKKGGFIGETKLPNNAKYNKFLKCYCLQLDKVVEIRLSSVAERGLQKAVAATGAAKDWEKVFTLSLASNDHLWGFNLTGYNREDDKGEDYAGKGDLYFSPVFHAGTLNPVKQRELHAKCVALQNAERAAHDAYKAKYAKAATDHPATTISERVTTYAAEPINTNVRANHFQQTEPPAPAHHAAAGLPTEEMQTDDLPF